MRELMRALMLAVVAWPLLLIGHDARAGDAAPVLIGHAALPRIDAVTVARLYTGRAVEVAGQPVTVVNAPAGTALRQRFLAQYLQQDEAQYLAYWTVRRHVGKGVPPRELASSAEVINFVTSTPGALGYIDASDAKAGLNVVARP